MNTPPPTPSPRWATENEAAKHIRVSIYTIRRWRDRGLITGYKVSRTVRYDLREIDDMLSSSIGMNQSPGRPTNTGGATA